MKRMAEPEFSVWDCRVCCDQMYGGPRCTEHNPSPEERDRRAGVSRNPISADVSRARPDERPDEEPAYAF